jgi:hypothetical protein
MPREEILRKKVGPITVDTGKGPNGRQDGGVARSSDEGE